VFKRFRDRVSRMSPNELAIWAGIIGLRFIATLFGAAGVACLVTFLTSQSAASIAYSGACLLVAAAIILTIPRHD
jgi:hypothetical protein